MTDWTERDLKISLDFLSEGNYSATIYSDIEESNVNPNLLKKEAFKVTLKDTIFTRLVSGGGNVIIISPVDSQSNLPEYGIDN